MLRKIFLCIRFRTLRSVRRSPRVWRRVSAWEFYVLGRPFGATN